MHTLQLFVNNYKSTMSQKSGVMTQMTPRIFRGCLLLSNRIITSRYTESENYIPAVRRNNRYAAEAYSMNLLWELDDVIVGCIPEAKKVTGSRIDARN